VCGMPDYNDNHTTTTVPMQLAPYESAFIVFSKNGVKSNATKSNYLVTKATIQVNQPWTVDFDNKMRGPAHAVIFNTLIDWTKSANDSIKYYSGTAWYHNTFNIGKIAKDAHYVIDLGLARAIAKVTVNGTRLDGVWTPPYQIDITKAIKPGVNKLEIKVVNTWFNRLVGDSRLPVDKRKTGPVVFGPGPESGLESSGLLGPVVIKEMVY